MEPGTIFIGVLVGFILLIIGIIYSCYNDIITLKNQAARSWADVLVWERLKIKLIPELIKKLQEYQNFEISTLEKITGLRSSIDKLLKGDDVSAEKLKEAQQKSSELKSIFTATAEAYPQLKTADLYKQMMQELSEAEANIAASLTIFNNGVQEFNNAIQTFPGSWVNSKFNKQQTLNTFTDSEAKKNIEYSPNF